MPEKTSSGLVFQDGVDFVNKAFKDIVVIDHGVVIAKGTASELKAEFGGDRLEVTLADGNDLFRTAEILRPRAVTGETVDQIARTVCIGVTDTHKIVPQVVRQLADDGIEVLDVVIRRPTLDDVFLQLTGHTAATSDDTEGDTP